MGPCPAPSGRTRSSYLGAYTGPGGPARIASTTGLSVSPGPVVSMAGDAVRRLGKPTGERTAAMNANYGYQLYQAERTRTRGEILAGDARRGRWAQASRRGRRSPARKGRGRGIMVMIAGRTARAA